EGGRQATVAVRLAIERMEDRREVLVAPELLQGAENRSTRVVTVILEVDEDLVMALVIAQVSRGLDGRHDDDHLVIDQPTADGGQGFGPSGVVANRADGGPPPCQILALALLDEHREALFLIPIPKQLQRHPAVRGWCRQHPPEEVQWVMEVR